MSVELKRPNGDSLLVGNFTLWTYILFLAQENGWEARGCDRPADWPEDEERGAMDYTVNAGQTVVSSDAMSFGEALARSLVVSDRVAREVAVDEQMTKILRRKIPASRDEIQPKRLTDPPAELLHKLARFCQGGEFSIE